MHTRFLDWNRPLLPAIAKLLLANPKGGFTDLSNTLVIVPTVQSGRRLREALALASNGLFPPEIVTPDGLLKPALKNESIASEATVVATWVSLFRSLDFTKFKTLFPIVPEKTVAWQYSMARRFARLRNELGEEGLCFHQVAQSALKSDFESERWRELAKLETLYLDQLKIHGLCDPKQIRRDAARSYRPPEQIKRIVLAATPDPQPIVLQALERAAEHIPVEIWIYGTEDAPFDRWGRPDAQHWHQRPLDFETWGVYLQSVTTPKTAAAFVVKSMQGKATESVLLGLADSALNPIVADALTRADIAHYDPEGQPLHTGAVGRLAELLCKLFVHPSTETVRSLLQHPDVQNWLNLKPSANQAFQQLDRIFENHLAPDLAALIYFADRSQDSPGAAELKNALKQLDQLAGAMKATNNFARSLAEKLQRIYAEKQIEATTESEILWKENAGAVRNAIQSTAEAEDLFPELPGNFAQTALEESLRKGRIYPTRPHQAHNLFGWLELLWNDSPHLILAGLNEHCVPESVTGDSFLPESLREQLGLRTNAQRFARDAYLLEALCRRRTGKNGRIDFLIPLVSHDQHPLKPSRLLFQGTSEQLLQRTRTLFQANEPVFTKSKHNRIWQLKPPQGLELPTSLPVSALKSYLQCPFRFFLRHILKMRPVDVETRELNAAAFGTLFHDTVARLRGDSIRKTTKPGDLIKKLHAIARHLFERRYGKRLSFALRLQYEALMERIVTFAEHQCDDVAENGGTDILETEESFEISLEDFVLKGRIDRIDQRGNRLELVDYKISNQPTHPENAHFVSIGKKTMPAHLPEEAFFEQDGKRCCWTDLQLPLYRFAKNPGYEKDIALAYFNLGQTIDKSGIVRWENFSQDLYDSSKTCAAAILKKIKAGVFWPPNQNLRESYDDFRELFPDGIENSVDAEAFANYLFRS